MPSRSCSTPPSPSPAQGLGNRHPGNGTPSRSSRTSCARIRQQASALRVLTEGLTQAELDTTLPALLLSNDALLVDDRLPLEALLDGLVSAELPGHTGQLAALRTDGAVV